MLLENPGPLGDLSAFGISDLVLGEDTGQVVPVYLSAAAENICRHVKGVILGKAILTPCLVLL